MTTPPADARPHDALSEKQYADVLASKWREIDSPQGDTCCLIPSEYLECGQFTDALALLNGAPTPREQRAIDLLRKVIECGGVWKPEPYQYESREDRLMQQKQHHAHSLIDKAIKDLLQETPDVHPAA